MSHPAPNLTIEDAVEQIGFGRMQKRLLAVCGATWAADAAEIFLISFALPGFSEEFGLSGEAAGLIVTATFLGMLVGAWFWGAISDRIGRRTGFQITIVIFAVFGLASAFAPGPVWLGVLRALTGFGLGGALPLDFSLFAEYLPRRHRGRWLVLLESFWAVGTVLAALLALFIMPTLGWRWLLATSAAAALLLVWVRLGVPESPRFLLAKGRQAQAREILEQVAKHNGRSLPQGQLTLPQRSGAVTLRTLLRRPLGGITATLWTTWFLIAFAYYGIFVWLPQIFTSQYDFLASYRYIFFLALVQLPGYFSAAWLIEKWGRKPVLASYLGASAIFTYLWAIGSGVTWMLFTAGLMSFFSLGAWAALYAYTPEAYPTQVRTSGMGAASGYARIGGAIAPIIGGVLFSVSLVLALSVFAVGFLLAGVAVALRATETKGKPLPDTLADLETIGGPGQHAPSPSKPR